MLDDLSREVLYFAPAASPLPETGLDMKINKLAEAARCGQDGVENEITKVRNFIGRFETLQLDLNSITIDFPHAHRYSPDQDRPGNRRADDGCRLPGAGRALDRRLDPGPPRPEPGGHSADQIRLFGLGQPLADGVKFLFKAEYTPAHVDKALYFFAPMTIFVTAIAVFAVIPFGSFLPATSFRQAGASTNRSTW